MKKIPLTKGKFALVDDEDFEILNQWKWYFDGRYAKRIQNRSSVYIHRLVFNILNGGEIDHKNGNKLDNRKRNLRSCTRSQNIFNSPERKDNTSGKKGVNWSKELNKWVSRIRVKKKGIYLGVFSRKEDAILVRKLAEKKWYNDYIYAK